MKSKDFLWFTQFFTFVSTDLLHEGINIDGTQTWMNRDVHEPFE
jgi:hypothetical protein